MHMQRFQASQCLKSVTAQGFAKLHATGNAHPRAKEHNFLVKTNLTMKPTATCSKLRAERFHVCFHGVCTVLYVQRCSCTAWQLHAAMFSANLSILLRNHGGAPWASTNVVEAQKVPGCESYKTQVVAHDCLLCHSHGTAYCEHAGGVRRQGYASIDAWTDQSESSLVGMQQIKAA